MSLRHYLEQPFGTQWRKALLSLPRAVPDLALYFTSSEGPQPVVINLKSRSSHKIPLYVFIPPNILKASGHGPNHARTKIPVLIDFHGGGFIFGSCHEQAPFCAMFARELGCLAISVDYRLGPASKFPAAIEDAEDVLQSVLDSNYPTYSELRELINQHIPSISRPVKLDRDQVALSGFSSGGNLALNLALSVDAGEGVPEAWPSVFPSAFPSKIPLLLYYPSLDSRQLPSERPRPPGMEPSGGFLASLRLEEELMPTYLPRNRAGHPRASPGLAEITDGRLHPHARMFLVLPELDTLAEQSEVWVKKVAAAGRGDDLEVERVKGVLHGWTQFPDSFLSEEHRRLKTETFRRAKDFVRNVWGMT